MRVDGYGGDDNDADAEDDDLPIACYESLSTWTGIFLLWEEDIGRGNILEFFAFLHFGMPWR